MCNVSHILEGQSLNFNVIGMYTLLSEMVIMKEARTLLPPCGLRNFSRIVCRGIRRRSPGSVSSNPISTKFMGSIGGVVSTGVSG